jgi:hypothetical protein
VKRDNRTVFAGRHGQELLDRDGLTRALKDCVRGLNFATEKVHAEWMLREERALTQKITRSLACFPTLQSAYLKAQAG